VDNQITIINIQADMKVLHMVKIIVHVKLKDNKQVVKEFNNFTNFTAPMAVMEAMTHIYFIKLFKGFIKLIMFKVFSLVVIKVTMEFKIAIIMVVMSILVGC